MAKMGAQEVTNFMAFYALQQEDDRAAVDEAVAEAKRNAGN